MAFKFGSGKFDDPDKKVDASVNKIEVFENTAQRRAFQGIMNGVLGTTGLIWLGAGIGTAGSAGFKINNTVSILINGIMTTAAAEDNLFMPEGTQGTSTAAKYLIAHNGTSGTVVGPGNVINMNDYSTVALASAAAKLPDLPDGMVALGYVNVCAPSATILAFSNDAGFAVGKTGTTGTGTFVDLACMPYSG
jgi:hypothetical protein